MSSIKLKPCPFCGSEAALGKYQGDELSSNFKTARAHCIGNNCGAEILVIQLREPQSKVDKGAIDKWNTRVKK